MTSTVRPTAAPVAVPAGPLPTARTPDRLRLLMAVVTVTVVAVGAAVALTLHTRSQRIASAQVHAAQAVRLQAIATDLAQADAVATTAFLSGAQESPAQRARYDAAVSRAVGGVTAAVAARPGDGPELATIGRATTEYVQAVASARTFNRLGQPLGTAFLLRATTQSREDILPRLDRMVVAEIAAGRDDLDAADLLGWALAALCLLGIGVPLAAQYRLARRTHRVLHPAMAGGTLLLALVLLASEWLTIGSALQVGDVDRGPFSATIDLARLRVSTFRARSAESMTLIRRGTGAAFEEEFRRTVDTARSLTTRSGLPDAADGVGRLDAWATAHAAVRAVDDKGDWERAVDRATDAGGDLATSFEAAAAWSAERLEAQAGATADGLAGARPSGALPVVVLLAGLAAAGGTLSSVLVRLEEYR